MYTYVTEELPELVSKEYPIDSSRMSITGHSMGIHILTWGVDCRWTWCIDFVSPQSGKI